jgi:hypothetical protein
VHELSCKRWRKIDGTPTEPARRVFGRKARDALCEHDSVFSYDLDDIIGDEIPLDRADPRWQERCLVADERMPSACVY